MKMIQAVGWPVLAVGLALGWAFSRGHTVAADTGGSIPSVIETGFTFYAKGQPEVAVDKWRKGGLLEEERGGQAQVNYLKETERVLGPYKSYEPIQIKDISRSSQIVYLSINFERGAIYGRFLLYRAGKDWVVQGMGFNTKPETIMPWLALEGDR
jgi:hypothetical protein